MADGAGWVLAVHAEGSEVALRLTNPDGAVRGSRRLAPGPGDCAALPDSVALLAKLWFGGELALPAKSPPTPTPPVRQAPPAEPARLPVAERPRPEPIAIADPPLPAPPLLDAATAPPELAPPPATEFEIARPSPLGRTASPLAGWSVLGLGGAAFDGRDGVGAGGGAIEWEFLDAWALSLEAGLQSDRLGSVAAGSVAVSVRWATLTVRRFFAERVGLAAGVQVVHFHASPRGFSDTRPAEAVTPALTAQLEWRQPITGGLFGVLRLDAAARLAPQAFVVSPIGRVITVPWWTAGGSAGVGWRF